MTIILYIEYKSIIDNNKPKKAIATKNIDILNVVYMLFLT